MKKNIFALVAATTLSLVVSTSLVCNPKRYYHSRQLGHTTAQFFVYTPPAPRYRSLYWSGVGVAGTGLVLGIRRAIHAGGRACLKGPTCLFFGGALAIETARYLSRKK